MVTEYGWRTMFDNSAYLGRPAIIPSQVGNDDLKWEDTEAWDIGFEFGLFDNQRIKGSFRVLFEKIRKGCSTT